MSKKIGKCVQCGYNRPLNSKNLCPDCVFKNNHGGKTKFEVYKERSGKNKGVALKNKKRPSNRLKMSEKKEKRNILLTKDHETYKKVFDLKPNVCEECGCTLPDQFLSPDGEILMISQYSHILGKKRYPEFRHDVRNFNRLCFNCHQQWDFGDKEAMKIYEKNSIVILELLNEKHGKKNTGYSVE